MNHHVFRAGVRRGALACLIVSIVVAGVTGGASAQETNLDVMGELTRGAAGDIIEDLNAARGQRGVRLVGAVSTEQYRFIEGVFTSVLKERGVPVYTGAKAAEGDNGNVLELHYDAVEFAVMYPKVFRSYLIGGKKVRRDAVVTIVGTLIDPSTGAVLDVAEATREASDQFSHGHLGSVEQGQFEFLHPPVPSSGWTRVVEPVFVSGIIVGLIYLFFSNQSDT
jgi:hypothetical protein